jgi:glycolate oxidase iron-sulfur subunit
MMRRPGTGPGTGAGTGADSRAGAGAGAGAAIEAGAGAGAAAGLRREESRLLACVHCGFCLNACPTYTRLGHEGDSPRGRLDLMRAVAEGRLDAADPAFQLHIDQCLGCRACEPVCPSGVPYGFLLERARAALAAVHGVSPSARLLIAAYTGALRHLATPVSRALRASGIARLLARLLPGDRLAAARFGLAMLASSAPWRQLRQAGRQQPGASGPAPAPRRALAGRTPADRAGGPAGDTATDPERAFAEPHALMGAYPAATAAPGRVPEQSVPATPAAGSSPGASLPADPAAAARLRVGVLGGCVQQALFARVNAATERVLAVNGCEVVAVRAQRCCGALDAHAGRLSRARQLAQENIAAFEAAGVDVIVVNAAGCGAAMKEYAEQLEDDPEWAERARAFVLKVRDLSELLVGRGVRVGAPVSLRVTCDAPCHLHHGQRIREAPLQLLDAIPGLQRVPLHDADECCGGAGLYGVHHPELGGSILADKVAAIAATGADAVATPNPGCMMQIGAGLLLRGLDVRVLHPVELLDESYRRLREGM